MKVADTRFLAKADGFPLRSVFGFNRLWLPFLRFLSGFRPDRFQKRRNGTEGSSGPLIYRQDLCSLPDAEARFWRAFEGSTRDTLFLDQGRPFFLGFFLPRQAKFASPLSPGNGGPVALSSSSLTNLYCARTVWYSLNTSSLDDS